MRRSTSILGLLLLGLGCSNPDPGTIIISASVAQGGAIVLSPGAPLGLVQVRRVGADEEEIMAAPEVTLTHSGDGELRGTTTLTLANGIANFEDLSYLGCGSFTLTATVDDPRIEPARTASISVRPILDLLEGPSETIVDGSGPIGRVAVRLIGDDGSAVALDGIRLELVADGVTLTGNTEATTANGGLASFDMLEVSGAGLGQLRVVSSEPTCAMEDLLAGVVAVGDVVELPSITMPSGRVGVPYDARFEGVGSTFLTGELPPGLDAEDGRLVGIPTAIGWHRADVFRIADGIIERRVLRVAIFPNHDPELAEPLDPVAPGALPIDTAALTLPSVALASGMLSDVAIRVAYPSDGAGALAEGTFPLIVFLPTLADPPALYDQYTELHDHWASHGFVVASVDNAALAMLPESIEAIDDQRDLLLAALGQLQAEHEDSASGFFEALDLDQVFVAGHGRGAGGALAALRVEERLAGVIAIAPVVPDLLLALGPSIVEPEPLPARPALIIVGSEDRVVPWPNADLAGSMMTGPFAAVTILGTNHIDSVDEGAPHVGLSPSTISRAERHAIERRYSTAFLHRFARGELGFEASLFGRRGQSTDLSSVGVAVRARRRLDTELPIDVITGDGNALTAGLTPYGQPLSDRGVDLSDLPLRMPYLLRAGHFQWTGSGVHSVFLPNQPLNVANRRRLIMDVMRPCAAPPADPMVVDDVCPPAMSTFGLELIDGALDGTTLDAATELGDAAIEGRHWVTVILEINDFDLDPGRLISMDLRFEGTASGELWIRDVRFE